MSVDDRSSMNKRNNFANLPLELKLRRLQVVTVGLALVFTLAVTSFTEAWRERKQILSDAHSTGNMIGFNAAAALLFNDGKSATDILAALRNKPNIVAARLYSLDGLAFADYLADGRTVALPVGLADAQAELQHNARSLFDYKAVQAVEQNGEVAGHLYMLIDLKPLWADVLRNIGQISLVTLIAFFLSSYFGKGLSAVIAEPLIRLSALARLVSREKNYTVRAAGGGNDEVGQLVNSFNSMIEQVQERDAELEKQRDQLEMEVSLRTADLREAVNEAQAASVAKSQFLANMSHEIRTPMNGVLGMTELLLGTELNATQRQYAETVFNSADSLLTIINDILDFSKIEAGKMELEDIDFNLNDLCEQVSTLFYDRAQQSRIELSYEMAPEVEDEVRGDPYRLRQILTNLLSNALKFTEKGSIKLQVDQVVNASAEVSSANVDLVFQVSDTGIGIAEEAMSRLFRSFSQADGSTTRKYGGTGLGLVISKELCELMGGSIEVNSELGQGTVFIVKLPLRRARAPVPLSSGFCLDIGGKRALIVEDNPTNASIIASHLANFGMHYRTADSAAQGLAMLEQAVEQGQPFDVALLDMKMQGMNGADMCRQIRKDPRHAGLKIVIITSSAFADELARIRACGCDRYLDKPLRKRALQDALRQLLVDRTAEPVVQSELAGVRVLLAEDNPVNQKLAMAMLNVLGCRVESANNGLNALEIYKAGAFDIILMDCMMPTMDGYTATENIRRLEQADDKPAIPILALTANAMEGDREKCLAAGMSDYLAKPFLLETLRTKISQLLKRQALTAEAATLERPAANIQFDPTPLATMRKMGGDQLVAELLALFYGNVPQLFETLEQGMSAGDAETVCHAAHNLKSAAGNLGAISMADLARDMEHAARSGSLRFDLQQVANLRAEYASLCRHLARQEVG